MTIQQDFTQRPHIVRDFTATGQVGPDYLVTNMTGNLRVAVENVGGGNVLLVKGRLEGQSTWVTLETITGPTSGITVDISVVDQIQFECTTYSASGGIPKVIGSGFFKQATGGGGGGSINDGANVGAGGIGVYDGVVGDTLNFRNINAASAKITVALDNPNKEVDIDVDPSQIDVADLAGVGTLNNTTFVGTDSSGNIESMNGWSRDTTSGGANVNLTQEPNNLSGGFSVHAFNTNLDPIANSPNESWTLFNQQIGIDTQNDGFSLGTTGQAARFYGMSFTHQGESDIGALEYLNLNSNIGNGTDAIDINGLGFVFGFGNVAANVNFSGPIQGYGFQVNVNASATIDPTDSYLNAFYDFSDINCPMTIYQSFVAGPSITEIVNNKNYTGFNANPTIDTFTGNASFYGVSVAGNLGIFDTGQYYGVSVNPTVDETKDAYGFYASMDNVTVYAGTIASLVIQDLTIAADSPSSDGNTVTIEYTTGGTAGSEVVSNTGLAFSVQIQSGVSTATQIAAALNAYFNFTSILNVTISGVGSNPQVAQAPTNLAGGSNPGVKRAAYFDGDVEITGSLTFGGALSIGKLSAFAAQTVVSGGGNPASIHGLVSQPTIPASATITNGDTFGINTAALITVGANASFSSGALGLGLAALGLPAVASIGASATVDVICGAVFALSLDGGSGAGSNIDDVHLCRAVSIPNGITTVGELRGYYFDLPFGDPGTTTWGVYMEPTTANNYMAKNLVIGTADLPTNSSVGFELVATDRAMLVSRMDSTAEGALTAVNGMIIYNTTTNKFRGYENGAWVDLV